MFLEMQRKKKEKKKQEDHHPLGFCAFAFHSPGRLGWDGMDGLDGWDHDDNDDHDNDDHHDGKKAGGRRRGGEALYMLTPDHPPPAELTGNLR